MPEITPLDLILLRREEVSAHLNAHGLRNARVVGWAGARLDLAGPAEIEVDMPMVTDLIAGDLGRVSRDLSRLVGFEISGVAIAARPENDPARREGRLPVASP